MRPFVEWNVPCKITDSGGQQLVPKPLCAAKCPLVVARHGSIIRYYARVSKIDHQDTRAQVKALKKAGCRRIFEENASGGRWERPELHRALDQLRESDVLVVWKLDRLS